MGEPFIDLWRRNAATNPEEYRSSESDVSEWDSLLPPVAESFQVGVWTDKADNERQKLLIVLYQKLSPSLTRLVFAKKIQCNF